MFKIQGKYTKNSEGTESTTEKKEVIVDDKKEVIVDDKKETIVDDKKEIVDDKKETIADDKKEIVIDDKKEKEEPLKRSKETEKFLKFLDKNPDSTMQDFISLQKDWKKVNDIDVLREKIKDESGLDLSNEKADVILKKKYGLDPDDKFDDLEESEKVAMEIDANKYRIKRKSSQDDELASFDTEEESKKEEKSRPSGETVTLSNGKKVDKKAYLEARKGYEDNRQDALDDLKEAKFSFKFNDGDGEKSHDFSLKYTEEDKQRMLSATEDTDKIIEHFAIVEGKFSHSNLNEGLLWANKQHRESVLIPRLLSHVFSSGIETQLKEERNVNFGEKKTLPKKSSKKNEIDYGRLPNSRGLTSKYKLNKQKQ